MHYTRLLVIAILVLSFASPSYAQEAATASTGKGGFGLGIIVGNPTGVSFKKWVGANKAIDGAAAWKFSGDGYLQVHADLLFHNFKWIDARWPVYYGVGAVIGIGDDFLLGARVPIGISHLFESAPFDVFLEVVPRLDLIPDTDFDLDAAIGFRYYFGG